jgi:23S rRNA (cytosine1962-C5)-methyltransferase
LAREYLIDFGKTNAYRLVHGESDGLPGLIVDRYGDTIVFQCLSSGAEYWRETLAELLIELTGCENFYERSDSEVRILEGLEARKGIFRGEEFKQRISIVENGLSFWVDIRNGHKTGYYLDQRANRSRIREISRANRVLDCFTYTGGFSINALAGGADQVVAIDSSVEALELAKENLALNATLEGRVDWVEGDVFQVLRSFRDRGEKFDLIILDPPKFAPTISHVRRAARAYKDINLLAFKLLRRGGFLSTFSCSGGINQDLFQKIVAGAALDACVEAQIIEYLHQGPDHPVSMNCPEGAYLKGFLIRALD